MMGVLCIVNSIKFNNPKNEKEQQIDVESNQDFDIESIDVNETNTIGKCDDANLFLFSLTPLKVIGTKNNNLVFFGKIKNLL